MKKLDAEAIRIARNMPSGSLERLAASPPECDLPSLCPSG